MTREDIMYLQFSLYESEGRISFELDRLLPLLISFIYILCLPRLDLVQDKKIVELDR